MRIICLIPFFAALALCSFSALVLTWCTFVTFIFALFGVGNAHFSMVFGLLCGASMFAGGALCLGRMLLREQPGASDDPISSAWERRISEKPIQLSDLAKLMRLNGWQTGLAIAVILFVLGLFWRFAQ